MKDLDPELKIQVVELCNKAVEAQEDERFHASNRDLQKVYELIPEPKAEWKAYVWLLSSMADNHFEQYEYVAAFDLLEEVFTLDDESKNNGYLCLRRGQCALELEHDTLAKQLLSRAFELEGKELFEDEHSKYLKLAKQA